MMKLACSVILLSVLLCSGMQCGGMYQPVPDCLTISDVINIGAGDATGNTFSGVYRRITAVRTSCVICEGHTMQGGDCDPATIDPEESWAFVQQNGRLTITATFQAETWEFYGGVNADGSFIAGGIGTLTYHENGSQSHGGQALVLIQGSFAGNQIVATLTVRITGNTPSDGDADVQSDVISVFQRL